MYAIIATGGKQYKVAAVSYTHLPDPVKTTVIDMTPLNLVEMTRKKEKRPLWEQIAQVQKKS